MQTRHVTTFSDGHSVVPRIRVALGKVQLLELEYVWEGVKGTIPELSMDLAADPLLEKVYLAAVYQNASGQRQVVIDSSTVDMTASAESRVNGSPDTVLASGGWNRLFTIFQVFVPPGMIGSAEDENTTAQVFEFNSRS